LRLRAELQYIRDRSDGMTKGKIGKEDTKEAETKEKREVG
jgi:hypothetical protein